MVLRSFAGNPTYISTILAIHTVRKWVGADLSWVFVYVEEGEGKNETKSHFIFWLGLMAVMVVAGMNWNLLLCCVLPMHTYV
jgi:hypothetical protein